MKGSWFVSAGAIAIAGFMVAKSSHENVAERIGDAPGQVRIIYTQPAPGLGKLVSLGCAGGVAFCLWKAIEETPAQQSQPQIQATPRVKKASIASTTTQIPASIEYDEDPEIEYEEEVVQPEVAPIPATVIPQVKQALSVSTPVDLIATCDGKKRHVFFACQTQTGKTTTVLSAIERKNELSKGAVDWTIFDPKKSVWLGLENQTDEDGSHKVTYMDYDTPSDILKMEAKLKKVIAKMTARQKLRNKKQQMGETYTPRPHVLLFDEWPSTRKLAQWYDQDAKERARANGENAPASVWSQIKRMVEILILNGLEDGFIVWLITQMPNCDQNDIDGGLRDQFGYWCQGRDGDNRSIEAALGNNWIVNGKNLRGNLQAQLEGLPSSPTPIVYTNIGGHKLFEMPYVDGNALRSKRIFGASEAKNKVLQFPKAVGFESEPLEDPWS